MSDVSLLIAWTNRVWPPLQPVNVVQKEQTIDHVVLQCPHHQPPHGLHDLTVLDNE